MFQPMGGQSSKVRGQNRVWIKLISFSRTDSKHCRLSLWTYPIFPLRVQIMSAMWPLTGRWQNHLAQRPWILVINSPPVVNRLCGNRSDWSTHVSICCSRLFRAIKYQTHLSSSYLLAALRSMNTVYIIIYLYNKNRGCVTTFSHYWENNQSKN